MPSLANQRSPPLASCAMNVLVTGGAGFIGSNLSEQLLAAGHRVCIFDDLNDFYNPARKERNLKELQALGKPLTIVRGTLTDARAVEDLFAVAQFDQVIHLAARAGVRPSLEDPVLYQEVNVTGTVRLLEAARKRGVKKITIASSSSVYGVNSKSPFSESDPIFHPISPYAASKLACEALGHVYHHLYKMDIAMLRFFTVYGPRQRPDLAICKFVERITHGKPIPVFGDGSTARDYTYVSDTVAGIIACTQKEFGYEVFNLGNSDAVKLSYLIELLEKAVGKKAIIDRQPMQPGDVPFTCADISKAQRLLGYNPKVKIEEGIPRFVEWFTKHELKDSSSGFSRNDAVENG
jgi:UDP-glucuronate 4-epimerase